MFFFGFLFAAHSSIDRSMHEIAIKVVSYASEYAHDQLIGNFIVIPSAHVPITSCWLFDFQQFENAQQRP